MNIVMKLKEEKNLKMKKTIISASNLVVQQLWVQM